MFLTIPLEFFSLGTISMLSPMGLHNSNQRCAWDNVLLWPSFGCVNEHNVHEHPVRPKIIECNGQFSHKLNKYVQSDRM
jgi:hypothetical protein